MSKRAPAPAIVPREKLNFHLDQDIPRHWLGGDAFQTRFFDAMSTLFPVGERFFITCVRDFKDRITDPELLQHIKEFNRQEAQHGIVHTAYNRRLEAQGVNVQAILEGQERRLFGIIRKKLSREFTLGITAASEHITAIMADAFVERPEMLSQADERIRAIYVWHAMEEMEHKAVAFDVLQKHAKASYLTRVSSMMLVTLLFPFHVFRIMSHMLRVDGLKGWALAKVWAKGLWWLYKPGGVFLPLMGSYFSYLKPSFHPWDEPVVESYPQWLRFMKESDPVEASNRLVSYVSRREASAVTHPA